jgi:hypothetical protein
MKKVTLTDLNGKEIEVYFADDKTAGSIKHNDSYKVKIEDLPTKHWVEMTGGNKNAISKEDALAAGWDYYEEDLNELDANENSAGEGAHEKNLYQKLSESFLNKVKDLEQSGSQIKIDDTIPSDFIELSELRNGAIYKVAGLNLIAKLVNKEFERDPSGAGEVHYNPLLKMKRHGTVFYVEKGSLMKATDLEVELYLEESN